MLAFSGGIWYTDSHRIGHGGPVSIVFERVGGNENSGAVAGMVRGIGELRGGIAVRAIRAAVACFVLAGVCLGASEGQSKAQEYIKRGSAKYRIGDFDGAIAEFSEAIRTDPTGATAYVSRGLTRSKKGDLNGAIEDYSKAIELSPESGIVYFNRAQVRSQMGDAAGAMEDFNEVIKIDPNFAPAYANRGNIREFRGDIQGAIEDYNATIRLNPRDAAAFFSRGNVKFNLGDYTGAIADYSTSIYWDPLPAEPFYKRGLAKYKLDNMAGAIADYSEAIRNNSSWTLLYNSRGIARRESGDYNGAIGDFSRVLRIDPKDANAYINRGIAQQIKGRYDQAIADFSEALRLNPQDARAYGNRGNVKRDKGDCSGAIADYSRMVTLMSKEANPYRKRGYQYFDMGLWSKALRDLSQAYTLSEDGLEHDYDLLRIWLATARLGQREEVTSVLREHLKNRKSADSNDWYSKVGNYLVGALSEDALLDAATNADDKTEMGQKCEATFYAGSVHLIDGDIAGGLSLLKECLGTGATEYTEYTSAKCMIEITLMGTRFELASADDNSSLALGAKSGVQTGRIQKDGPAMKGGLQEKDLLLSISGESATLATVGKTCDIFERGDEIRLDILRDGQRKEILLKMGNWN